MSTALLADRPGHVPADRVVDFDIYDPPGVAQDFHVAWKTLQAPGVPDLVWTPRNGGHWLATRAKLIAEVYSDYERFSNHTMLVPKLPMKDGGDARHIVPSYLDPPEHRPFRMLLNSTFAPKAIQGLESKIRDQAVSLIESVRQKGRCDFITTYADLLPIRVFMSLVDLPSEDAPMLKSWAERITTPDSSLTLEQTRAGIEEAHRLLHDYLRPHIEARRGGQGQDMFSRMVNGKVDGRNLTESEMMDMCTQVMFGGLDTVVNFLGFTFLFLATHAKERRALAADASLIRPMIDELVRRFAVVTVGREVQHDTIVDGTPLKAGEMIMAPTPLAGLDDRLNDHPMDVDLNRSAAEHVTFGEGPHRCPGALLARTEVRISLEEWLARVPDFELATGAAITYRGGVVGRVCAPLLLVWPVPAH